MVTVLKRPVVWLLALVLASTGVLLGRPGFAVAATLTRDEINIEKLTDGTHKDGKPLTYVTTEHGYPVGDNSPNDGVVTSGDVVTYKVTLLIKPGPARSIALTAKNAEGADALQLGDITRLNLNAPGVTSTQRGDTLQLQIPRGYTAKVEGTVSIRAKDTAGSVVEGNAFEVVLSDPVSNQVISNRRAEPVKVVSVPMADLTLETDRHSMNQSDNGGSFTLRPRALSPEGYSDFGLSAAGAWKADVDVSEFPNDQLTWTFDGQTVTPENGVIRNLEGTGAKQLAYTFNSTEGRPLTPESSPIRYTARMTVSEDSFKTGEMKNIPDPGNGQPDTYDTATHTDANGTVVGATRGTSNPNNNAASNVWVWYEKPKGAILGYEIYAPRSYYDTVFAESNRDWDTAGDEWFKVGEQIHDSVSSRNEVTSDTDVRHKATIVASELGAKLDTSKVTLTHKLIDGEVDWNYDSSRLVEVTVNGDLLPRDKFAVSFLVGEEWVEIDQAPAGATESKVTFVQGAFVTGENAPNVVVNWPGVTKSDYQVPGDNGKALQAEVALSAPETSSAVIKRTARLTFPQKPTATVNIFAEDQSAKPDAKTGAYHTSWTISAGAENPVTPAGHSGTIKLTLSEVYDPATFTLQSSSWEVSGRDGNVITLTTSSDLTSSGDSWQFQRVNFDVSTVPFPGRADNGPIDGTITADFTLNYPEAHPIAAGTDTADDTDTQTFDSLGAASAVISADPANHKGEVTDPLSWTSVINTGHLSSGENWKQEFRLPQNNDIQYMDDVNAINNTEIRIDPETGKDTNGIYDGVGRSKYNGDYKLTDVTVTGHSPTGTRIRFYKGDAANPQNVLTVDVPANGKVDLSKVTDQTHFEISGPGNSSDVQNTVIQVHTTITPKNNRAGDVYVMWLGETFSPDISPDRRLMAWPDHIEIVSSSISGVVYRDDNGNATLDENEADNDHRYQNVTVEAQRKNAEGKFVSVASVETNELGEYRFEHLHSGEYRVVLKDVTVTKTDAEVTLTKGDGELPASVKNDYGKTLPTKQTQSGDATFENADRPISVTLPVDASSEHNDFGFTENRPSLTLDKSQANVSYESEDADVAEVSWNVTVTNTGDTPIEGLQLHDRTSAEVQGVTATVSYLEDGNGYTGTPVDIAGATPPLAGAGLVTDEGFWYINNNGEIVNQDIREISGTPIDLVCDAPSAGCGILTTQGYWIVEWTTDLGDYVQHKAEGITGTPIAAIGQDYGNAVVLTDQGLWEVGQPNGWNSELTVNQLTAFEGTPVRVEGPGPGYFFLATRLDSGEYAYWHVGSAYLEADRFHRITGITGEPVDFSGTEPITNGSDFAGGVATTEGYWIVSGEQVTKVKLSGTPIAVSGAVPTTNYGSIAATDQGVWLVSDAGNKVEQVTGIQGTPIDVIGYSPVGTNRENGSAVITTAGYWLIDGSGTAKKVAGITGTPIAITGQYPTTFLGGYDYGSAIVTTDGVWFVNGGGSNVVPVGKGQVPIDGQSLPVETSDAPTKPYKEQAEDGSSWWHREYKLPKLLPGEKINVTLTGNVIRNNDAQVLGNQAWVTSETTPRSGITAVKVSADGKNDGVPTIPSNLLNIYDPDYIPSSDDTVGVNPDWNWSTGEPNEGKDMRPFDDLADQTPALIQPMPVETNTSGAIEGDAWYDNDGNNQRDPSDGKVSGMTVSVSIDGTLYGQTNTDNKGHWRVENLPVGKTYDVAYEVAGWKFNGKVWTPVQVGQGTSSGTDSDANAIGVVDGMARKVELTEANPVSVGRADLGLRTSEADASVVKGQELGLDSHTIHDAEKLTDKLDAKPAAAVSGEVNGVATLLAKDGFVEDSDGDARTVTYQYVYDNNGNEPLRDVTLKDTTVKGNAAVISSDAWLLEMGPEGSATEGQWIIRAKLTVKDGILMNGNEPVVVMPGQRVVGSIGIAFTKGNDDHENNLEVTASVVGTGDPNTAPKIDDLTVNDGLNVKYDEVKPQKLTIQKVNGAENGEGLEGARFRFDLTNLQELPNSDSEVGEVEEGPSAITSADGIAEVYLKPGVYQVTEVTAPDGYFQPQGVWYVKVGFNTVNGVKTPVVEVKASKSDVMPYAVGKPADASAKNTYGAAMFTNEKLFTPPVTGGQALFVIAGGLGLLIAGAAAAGTLRRKQATASA